MGTHLEIPATQIVHSWASAMAHDNHVRMSDIASSFEMGLLIAASDPDRARRFSEALQRESVEFSGNSTASEIADQRAIRDWAKLFDLWERSIPIQL